MAPQQPTRPPTPASGVQVVTLTVFSTGSAGSTGVPASSRGGSSVPIAAIAGGAAAGVTLAVAMVLIWKYWGLVIKRTERRKRKEAQEILTVRENTRRNAATRSKPQSSLHPILRLDPEGRRVKFLTRTPTLTLGKTGNDNTAAPAAIPPTVDSEKETVAQPEMRTAADPGPTDNTGPRQPSLRFAPAPAPRLVYEPWEPEPKSEGGEQQQPEAEEETNSHPPEPAPEEPTPTIPSTSHGPSGRSNSSAPITPTSPFRDTSNHPPSFRPSRSTRMRTPTRLPNPPDAPPIPVRGARRHSARLSSSISTPSGSQTPSVPPPRPQAASPRRPPSGLATPPISGSPIPPPGLAAAAVGPFTTPSSSSTSTSTSLPPPPPRPAVAISPPAWVGSSLHNSVLASDRPVIMPRAKRASQPGSPSSTLGQLPTLASSASHISAGDEEPSARDGLPNLLRHADHSTETTGENAQQTSPSSTPSAYSDG